MTAKRSVLHFAVESMIFSRDNSNKKLQELPLSSCTLNKAFIMYEYLL
jgi:hypothetical protein